MGATVARSWLRALIRAVDCTVDFFPLRALKGWPDNEYVPAYRCPDDHPYLVTTPYAPFGWTLGPGFRSKRIGVTIQSA